ncbi:MAG: hypothetical protein O3B01_08615 [Planctomycetota bacterium]|nr:hypothetical protein [Planctomycetota bacterium]
MKKIHEDTHYSFVYRHYGNQREGVHTPGLFVHSKETGTWMEVKKLSTKGAKLGRDPNIDGKIICSVGWDYRPLAKKDYVEIPLMTSGSVNFPDTISYEEDRHSYFLLFNSNWEIEAVLSKFEVKKADLDWSFRSDRAEVFKVPEIQKGNDAHQAARPRTIGSVTAELSDTKTSDLRFVSDMPQLENLYLASTPVRDLSPLHGTKIKKLFLEFTQVADLSSLAGLPLTDLALTETRVTDLTPLKGLPLKNLYLSRTGVVNLTPLKGCPLVGLDLEDTPVSDLSPLVGMKLNYLNLRKTRVENLGHLKGMPIKWLYLDGAPVKGLRPLDGMPLRELYLTPENVRSGTDEVRKIKTLGRINGILPNAFGKMYDAAGFQE